MGIVIRNNTSVPLVPFRRVFRLTSALVQVLGNVTIIRVSAAVQVGSNRERVVTDPVVYRGPRDPQDRR